MLIYVHENTVYMIYLQLWLESILTLIHQYYLTHPLTQPHIQCTNCTYQYHPVMPAPDLPTTVVFGKSADTTTGSYFSAVF